MTIKKMLLTLTGTLGVLFSVSSAKASYSSCTAILESSYGNVLEEFTITDYDYQNACRVALGDCQRARVDRREPGSLCRLVNGRTPDDGRLPPNDRYTHRCEAVLKRGRGEHIRVYYGTGFSQHEACSNARYQCEYDIPRYNGPVYCDVNGDYRPGPGPRPNPGHYVGHCEYGLYDRYNNRLVRVYPAQTTGYNRTDAIENACRIAEQRCEREDNGPTLSCRRLRAY